MKFRDKNKEKSHKPFPLRTFAVSNILLWIILISVIYSNQRYIDAVYKNVEYIDVIVENPAGFEKMVEWTEEKNIQLFKIVMHSNNTMVFFANRVSREDRFVRPFIPNYTVQVRNLKELDPAVASGEYAIEVLTERLSAFSKEMASVGVTVKTDGEYYPNTLLILVASLVRNRLIIGAIVITLLQYVFIIAYFIGKRFSKQSDASIIKRRSKIGICGYIVLCIALVIVLYQLAPSFKRVLTDTVNIRQWQDKKDFYRIGFNDAGQSLDLGKEYALQDSINTLYRELSSNYEGFFMDAENANTIDWLGLDYPLTGIKQNGIRTHITVSDNYFLNNPIYTIYGENVSEAMIEDCNTLNVLMPEYLTGKQDELKKEMLDYFRFNRFGVGSAYSAYENQEAPVSLYVNIILVKDNQSYFTYAPEIKKENGNTVDNPVAVVFNNNYHKSWVMLAASRGLFFRSDSDDSDKIDQLLEKASGVKDLIYGENLYEIVISQAKSEIRDLLLVLLAVISAAAIPFLFMRINYCAMPVPKD